VQKLTGRPRGASRAPCARSKLCGFIEWGHPVLEERGRVLWRVINLLDAMQSGHHSYCSLRNMQCLADGRIAVAAPALGILQCRLKFQFQVVHCEKRKIQAS
jgi:hypothetical protein